MPPALLAASAGGTLAAAMYLSVLTGSLGSTILVYLAPLPLFLAGLAFGPATVLVAAGLATLLVLGIGGGFVLPLTFLMLSAVPAVIVVRRAMLSRQHSGGGVQWYPPGLLLVTLTGLGAVTIVGAAVLASVFGGEGGLKTLARGLLVDNLTGGALGATVTGPAHSSGSDAGLAETIAEVFPGVVAVSWLMMVVVNGLLAQAVLARFNRLMRPMLRMSELDLPGWTPLALALTALGAVVLEGEIGFLLVNLAIVQALPFFFSGLAVVHAFAARRASKVAILVAFYVLLSFLAWPVVAVIGLGIIEQWAGLRGRLAAATPDRGEA